MAATMDLSTILDSNELSSISIEIKAKLNDYYQTLYKKSSDLSANYEKLRVNSEQQYCDVERQLISSNTRLETELSANGKLKDQLEDLEKNFNEASEKLHGLQDSQEGNLSTQLRLTKVNEQLECEKREFAALLEKRNREIDTLNDEAKEMSRKLSEMNMSKCEALAKLDETRSNEANREFQVRRLEQECENLGKQIEWLNKDITEKTRELMNVRREKSTKLLEVQSQLESKTEEASLLKSTVDTLRQTNTDQAQKIDNFIQRIKDLQDSNGQSEEQFKQEIQARVRLADLYKTSADEAEAKATELLGAVTELQNLLKEAAKAHTDMETEKDEDIQKVKDEMIEKESKIENLEQELVNANDLLSSMKTKGESSDRVEAMFPTAAITSRMLKSGMTLTQIYNEYVTATDSLQLEKEENKRLNTYLDQILQEIQDKAPQLKKQREDYEISLRTIDQMTRQLDAAMLEFQTLRSEADESHRKSSHLMKENQKHQLTVRDLSEQVKYLVKEVEEMRGGRVVRDEDISSSEISSSSRLISDRLVTFGNINELQEQNQKLLAVIRELSDKQEQEENSAIDAKTRELKEQLELAQEELSHMKDARLRQTEMVESIVRQRDMYRILLQQDNSSPSPLTSFTHPGELRSPDKSSLKSPGADRDAQRKLEESNKALLQLQADFSTYKKEKLENEKILNEQLDKRRQDVSDLRVQNTKLASQLDFAAERNKVSVSNAEGYKKEIALMRDKLQKYTASVAKHEQTVNSQRQELMSVQEQLSQAQARVENVRAEKDMLKSSEQRLLAELDSLRRERHTQTMLMANLQAIQNNLERSEHESKNRLGKQIENLERERNLLKKRLESEEKQAVTINKHYERQVKELRGQIEQGLKGHQVTRDQLHATNTQISDLKQQLMTTSTKLATAETRLTNMTDGSGGSSEDVRDMRTELDQARSEIDSLQIQLHKAKEHTEQYKTIADSIQNTIKEQNEASENFKETLEEKLRAAEESCAHLTSRVDELEEERVKLLDENIRVTEDSHTLNADLRRKLVEVQNELQESNERRETAIALEMSAKQECEEQTKHAADAQDKYERELMLHAADVEALSALKKDMGGFNSKLSEKEEQARIAEQQLTELKASSEKRETMLKEERDKMSGRVSDLMQETQALHQQMNKLSNQVISVQERVAASPRGKPGTNTAAEEDTSKSSEQLLEIVRYLRKEKDIAEGKLGVVETECARLKQRGEVLERQLESANTQLSDEREQSQAGLQTAAQHAELMHRVESYNLLHDSNKLLREERDQILTKLTQAEAKLNKLEETIRPLQSDIRDLQSQKEALATDKKSITAEVERWKTRTNQLIEQSHKTDPEEHKRLVQEREEMRKQVSTITEELHKSKAEATKGSLEMAKAQRQLSQLKETNAALSKEIATVKKSVEEKEKDIKDKVKTMTQLRMVGRKYKTAAETAQSELDDMKTKQSKQDEENKQNLQQANTEQIQTLEQKLSEVESKLTESEGKLQEANGRLEQTDSSLKSAADEKIKLEQCLKEATEKRRGLEEQVIALKSDTSQAKERDQQIDEKVKEMKALQDSISALNDEKTELKKKLERSMTMLQSAKSKLQSMKEMNEKLTSERMEMKKKLADKDQERSTSQEEGELHLATMKSLYENKITKLEQEVGAKETLQKEITELQNKIKQLESSQKLVTPQSPGQVSRSAGSVVQDRTSFSTSQAEPPKTANIRPIASSPASIKPQTVPVQPQSAASKVTASIRPMAITPNVPSSTTPTATVMPTTVSQPEVNVEEETVTPVQQLFPQQSASATGTRPTQQVQRVIPTQESSSVDSVVESSSGSGETSNVEAHQSSSRDTSTTTIQHSAKRHRDQLESPGEETVVKRTRVSTAEPEADSIPEITVTDESGQVDRESVGFNVVEVTPVEGAAQGTTEELSEIPDSQDNDNLAEYTEGEEGGDSQLWDEATQSQDDQEQEQPEVEDDDDAVIIMSSEEEGEDASRHAFRDKATSDDQTGDEDGDDEDDDDDDEDMEGYDEGDDQEEDEYQDESGEMEDGEDLPTGDQQQDDDDDVVIIDEDDDDGEMDSQEVESQPVSQSSSQTNQSLVPPLQPLPPERQLSMGSMSSRNQLAPFMIGGHPSAFEDVDDCTVPSTPTLNVPRRGDGFAEAISSPQVSQRFIFGSGGEQQLTLSGLDAQAVLGMGMDDTRVDLSQLEDGSGRSVPNTPLHTSAPVTIITEASEPTISQSETGLLEGSQSEILRQEEAETGEDQLDDEGDLGEEGEGEGDLEGEQGEEDSDDIDTLEQDSDDKLGKEESGVEESGSREDVTGSLDKSQDNKPRIQKIVWEEPAQAQAMPTPIPSASQPIQTITGTGAQFHPHPHPRGGQQRGVPLQRGNRGFHRGPRRPMRSRGGSGMMYTRRPNMY